ncbi:vacuolar protein sorting-associated protein 53 homolog isoform X2 [Ornithodoros turicata]|uniref:vacuolar protein sorting-associated protein 53 homolog isoform X2 n=1 Tax=Ornithodoros turicata TaxID=34597 RepID=UPI003138F45E
MATAVGFHGDIGDIALDQGTVKSFVNFSPEVEKAIQQVLPSSDPLDSPDLNAVDYINTLFPTEQSLSNIDEVIARMNAKIRRLDEEIHTVVRGQTNVGRDGRQALQEAHKAIQQLSLCIKDIREKADRSEHMVKEITRDIKQLDHAKRHLTASITTLNHLHMLVEGVNELRHLQQKRHYGEVANLLQGVMNVVEHFHPYMAISQIRHLAEEVTSIRSDLAKQISADFHEAFEGPNAKHFTPSQQLAEACLVVSLLEPKVKQELLNWFVSLQLVEYRHLFQANQEMAWLDQLERRYAWLKKSLLAFEDKFGRMFPVDWEVSECIAVQFCHITRNELSQLMKSRVHDMDVRLLLHAIQTTSNFETLLSHRFTGATLVPGGADTTSGRLGQGNPFMEDNNPFSQDTDSNTEEEQIPQVPVTKMKPFQGIISSCFEQHLNIYVESQDRSLRQLVEQFATEPPPAVDAGVGVLPSCAQLFVTYKKCLVQCSQLSTGQPLLALAQVFKRHLSDYATRVLQGSLPKTGSTSSSAAALMHNFQSLLKEGETPRLTSSEVCHVCGVLGTAEYCLETTQQLEGKLKEKIASHLSSEITMADEQNLFHKVIDNCIQLLVQDLEAACEPPLTAMVKTQWGSVETVGDQSSYVTAITSHLRQMLPLVRDNLSNSRKYFTQFCVRFASSFIPKLIQQLFKCKPVSPVGAEQLLLDTHMLKTVLLDLPLLGSQVSRKAPASYTKIVVKGMTKAEMLLKVVMAPHDPPKGFVENYLRLLPDSDPQEFQKVLDMKGIKRSEQSQMVDIFRTHLPPARATGEGGTAAQLLTALTAAGAHQQEGSRIRCLEKLIKKRL